MNKRALWIGGARVVPLVGLLVFLVYFFFFTGIGQRLTHTNVKQLSEYLSSFGTYSVLLGMTAIFLQSLVPFAPFVLVAGANVLMFGLTWGTLINYSMAVAGALTAYLFARTFGHDRVERKLAKFPSVLAFNRKLEEQGFIYVLLGRLIPIIPSSAVSYGAGITKIRTRDYILGTILGKLPMVVLESFIGHDLLHFRQHRGRLLILLAVFVLLWAAGSKIKARMSGKPAE